MSEIRMRATQPVAVYYVNSGTPASVVENNDEYYFDHGDIPLEEVLDQEIVYQSLRSNNVRNVGNTSEDLHACTNDSRGSDERKEMESGESSKPENSQLQLAADEALARALQEIEDQLEETPLGETSANEEAGSSSPPSPTVIRESNSSNTTNGDARQDDVDPDNMTYEELQSLGEAIGTQGRGLSDELIGYLPLSKYKTGYFSRRDEHDECVICCMEYKNRDKLITLPCQHWYHSICITKWLKLNKACPVCQVDVFG